MAGECTDQEYVVDETKVLTTPHENYACLVRFVLCDHGCV